MTDADVINALMAYPAIVVLIWLNIRADKRQDKLISILFRCCDEQHGREVEVALER